MRLTAGAYSTLTPDWTRRSLPSCAWHRDPGRNVSNTDGRNALRHVGNDQELKAAARFAFTRAQRPLLSAGEHEATDRWPPPSSQVRLLRGRPHRRSGKAVTQRPSRSTKRMRDRCGGHLIRSLCKRFLRRPQSARHREVYFREAGTHLLRAQELGNRMQRPNAFADNLQAREHRNGNQSADNSPHPAEHDDRDKYGYRTECHSSTNHKRDDALPADRHQHEIDCGSHESLGEVVESQNAGQR
jgi:hypothetical protein